MGRGGLCTQGPCSSDPAQRVFGSRSRRHLRLWVVTGVPTDSRRHAWQLERSRAKLVLGVDTHRDRRQVSGCRGLWAGPLPGYRVLGVTDMSASR